MSKIDNILKQIATEGSIYDEIMDNILSSTRNYTLDKKSELISEIAISMLSNQANVLKQYESNTFKYWFIRVVSNQVKSTTSPFYKNARETITSKFGTEDFNFNMYDEEEDDSIEQLQLIENRMKLIQQVRKEINCTWFEAEVFKLYYDEGYTYRRIEEEFGIDHCLAWNSVKKVRERLKKAINNKNK